MSNDPMMAALTEWAAETGVTPALSSGQTAHLFGLADVPVWYTGVEMAWIAWNDLATAAEWTPAEILDAWAIAGEMDSAADITWRRDNGSTGHLRLVEAFGGCMALSLVGKHADAVYSALAPSLHRAMVNSGLADNLTAYPVELDDDGQPRITGKHTSLAEMLGVAPSEDVAQHALHQGIHAEPDPDKDKLIAVDLTGLLGDGRED